MIINRLLINNIFVNPQYVGWSSYDKFWKTLWNVCNQ